MDMIGEVLARAALFANQSLPETAPRRLETLCALAVEELSARLRPGADADAFRERFVSAAAALALSMYAAFSDSELDEVKVGAVTLRRAGGRSLADRLRALAEEMLPGELRENGFAFKEVAG